MGMSNAERQRLFRQRRDADAERRQAYLQKRRERYRSDLEQDKVKPIAQMSDREIRATRKKWRCQKRKEREQVKDLKGKLKHLNTPPSTHDYNNASSRQKEQYKKGETQRRNK
ncbi:hypothetical protein DPMN_046614 [Dreissena polymorpha]|uniref:Uncharacterized protein n=1 Tax=Dreissena polymorpha TaxID=45954 RepID=A0A9D4D8C8_DREPO|nr:hypothetical protein DPMN_046614 [Dreissena polymorpha]